MPTAGTSPRDLRALPKAELHLHLLARCVLEMLAERAVSLDVCLTSNHLLSAASIEDHPLLRLLAAGVRCSLGADDPLMFGVGLLDEYVIARNALGLPDTQVAALARTSIETSGADQARIAAWTARIDDWLAT